MTFDPRRRSRDRTPPVVAGSASVGTRAPTASPADGAGGGRSTVTWATANPSPNARNPAAPATSHERRGSRLLRRLSVRVMGLLLAGRRRWHGGPAYDRRQARVFVQRDLPRREPPLEDEHRVALGHALRRGRGTVLPIPRYVCVAGHPPFARASRHPHPEEHRRRAGEEGGEGQQGPEGHP